jgi:ribokinase
MLSIGDLLLDITIVPERRVQPDDDTPASITIGGGGQSANFCAWAASLGEEARLVTRVGDDDAGRQAVAELESQSVRVFATTGPEKTGAIAILVGRDGDRTMLTQRGASLGLRPDDLRPEWFEGVKLLHVPAYSLFHEPLASAAQAAIAMVRRSGGSLAVDLSSVAGLLEYGPARMRALLRSLHPDLLFATVAEAETVGGLEGLAGTPVVKLGPGGCLVGTQRVTAPAVDVVDPTGAGDAFAAAFCASFLHGASPVEAGESAVAVAADAVSRLGARPPAAARANR